MLWSSLVIYRVFLHFRWIPRSFQAHHWNRHGASPRIATIQGANPNFRGRPVQWFLNFKPKSWSGNETSAENLHKFWYFGISLNIRKIPWNIYPEEILGFKAGFVLSQLLNGFIAHSWKERTALRLRRINTTSGWLVIPYLWPLVGMAAGRGSTQSTAHPHRSFDPSVYRGKSSASLKTFAGQIPNWHCWRGM